MTDPITDTELAELQRLTQYLRAVGNTLWAHRVDTLVADLAHERDARREGERRLDVATYLLGAHKHWDYGPPEATLDLGEWQDRRDAFLTSASPKPGGNEKPEADND